MIVLSSTNSNFEPSLFVFIFIFLIMVGAVIIKIIITVKGGKSSSSRNNSNKSFNEIIEEIKRKAEQQHNNTYSNTKKSPHTCEYDPERIKKLNKTCPNCHSEIKDKHSSTCPVCGSSLKNICPNCGMINHPNSILCQECHCQLSKPKKHKMNTKHGKGEDSWMEF